VKLSDWLMGALADRGVRHVFFVSGGGAMHLDDSLGQCARIEAVATLHEQGASMAAETYAKIRNETGVCLVTTGPGGTNALTGLAGAWLDSTPMLVVSGQVKRADLKGDTGVRQMGVQEVDIVSMARPVTKYAVTVTDPASIRYHLEKAWHLASSGRPGPVWLDIPLDVQGAPVDADALPGFDPAAEPAEASAADVAAAVTRTLDELERAERPLLLVGNGVRLARAERELAEAMRVLDIPVQLTWLGHDLVPDDHPLFAGRPGPVAPRGANFALQNCDFLLAVGARLDNVVTGYAPRLFARAATKVMVDIDPAEIRKMGDAIHLGVVCDAGVFLRELVRQGAGRRRHDRAAWFARIRAWLERYPVVQPEYRGRADGVSTYVLAEAISAVSGDGDVIVSGSSGAGIEIFLLALRLRAGQRVTLTTALGAMGYCVPACIGASLALDRRRVVAVDGDGGFQLNVQELETIRRLSLPIKLFVLNNDGYASIRTSQLRYFGRLCGADASSGVTLPELRKVAEAYGIPYAAIATDVDLPGQVRRAVDGPGPLICEVRTPRDEPRAPSLASVTKADGRMVSRPLEDLWPFLDREELRSNMLIPLLPD
jgi:acetolactate synthase-1/2/3 large subunit